MEWRLSAEKMQRSCWVNDLDSPTDQTRPDLEVHQTQPDLPTSSLPHYHSSQVTNCNAPCHIRRARDHFPHPNTPGGRSRIDWDLHLDLYRRRVPGQPSTSHTRRLPWTGAGWVWCATEKVVVRKDSSLPDRFLSCRCRRRCRLRSRIVRCRRCRIHCPFRFRFLDWRRVAMRARFLGLYDGEGFFVSLSGGVGGWEGGLKGRVRTFPRDGFEEDDL